MTNKNIQRNTNENDSPKSGQNSRMKRNLTEQDLYEKI